MRYFLKDNFKYFWGVSLFLYDKACGPPWLSLFGKCEESRETLLWQVQVIFSKSII